MGVHPSWEFMNSQIDIDGITSTFHFLRCSEKLLWVICAELALRQAPPGFSFPSEMPIE